MAFDLHGHTEANRAVTVRAEVDGRVEQIGAARGARVAEGDLIVRLSARDRAARLAQAKALVEQRRIQYDGARRS